MLSKEEVLEIISYCDSHKIQRSVRLKELGITHWEFYKSRRKYLENEKSHPHEDSGSFIQLESGGGFVPCSVTEMTIECQTSRGGMVRINGKINAELLSVLVKNL